ncbi:uncharacterized protein LOC120345350 [Styela clava]
MSGWHFKRRAFVCLLSTVFFVTIGLHTVITFDWTRTQFTGPEEFLLREGRKASENNMNNARQLASYDNLSPEEPLDDYRNEGTLENAKIQDLIPPNKVKEPPKLPLGPMHRPGPVLQDIKGTYVQLKDDQDDEVEFHACNARGTLDMRAYPFVDARRIYCGDSKGMYGLLKPPGAIPLDILENELKTNKLNASSGGTISKLDIAVDPPMALDGISVSGVGNVIKAKQFSISKNGNIAHARTNRTILSASGKTYYTNSILFFPPILSEQWVLMAFLRTLYTECSVTSRFTAVTVNHASVHGKSVAAPFCVFLNTFGGGIKNAYVLWEGDCKTNPLPKRLTKCKVSDASI